MRKIEIEVRTFISPAQYKSLEKKLKSIAKFVKEVQEQSAYFSFGSHDLRLKQDERKSYLIFKSGKIHDRFRDEIEIVFKRADFEKLQEVLGRLGMQLTAMWFRKRKIYDWEGVKVFLGDTRGYGYIIELEKFGDEKNKERIFRELQRKLGQLGIKKLTPKSVFNKKFAYYLKNWEKLV